MGAVDGAPGAPSSPIGVITAIVVAGLAGRADEKPSRLATAVTAGLVARWTDQLWAGILTGKAIYWLLRLTGTLRARERSAGRGDPSPPLHHPD